MTLCSFESKLSTDRNKSLYRQSFFGHMTNNYLWTEKQEISLLQVSLIRSSEKALARESLFRVGYGQPEQGLDLAWLVKAWFSRFSKDGRSSFQVSGSALEEIESCYFVSKLVKS